MVALLGIPFWFFYLLVCPAATVAALLYALRRDDKDRVNLFRLMALTVVLILIFGPIWTDLGLMSWWLPAAVKSLDGSALVSTKRLEYFVWHYAVACLIFQALVTFFRYIGDRRPSRKRDGER
jgi:hypothetical protein